MLFRSLLNRAGVKLISSKYANSNVDLPSMPPETAMIFDNKEIYAVIDLGGDDRGAYALGRYSAGINKDDSQMLFVVNKYRPLTKNAQSALQVMKEIELAAKVSFTGIVNNSNLGKSTTAQDVLNSIEYAEEISKESGLPVVMTSVIKAVGNRLSSEIDNLFLLDIIGKEIWKI